MATQKTRVILSELEGDDVLKFELFDNLTISFKNEDQSSLRVLFYKIIEHLFIEKIEFELDYGGYSKPLFIDIAVEYIRQLNTEITSIFDNLPNLE